MRWKFGELSLAQAELRSAAAQSFRGLLVLSREHGNTVFRGYIGMKIPDALLSPCKRGKGGWLVYEDVCVYSAKITILQPGFRGSQQGSFRTLRMPGKSGQCPELGHEKKGAQSYIPGRVASV